MIKGIDCMVPECEMDINAKMLRETYKITPNAPIIMREFGFYSIERWVREGHIKNLDDLAKICGYHPNGFFGIGQLGWCEAEFAPQFEEKIIEDRGEHEVVQDFAGRHVLFFKGRRSGFMPEYLDHPVKDIKSWEEQCKWRLDPKSPIRMELLKPIIDKAIENAKKGLMIQQCLIGGFMYLRSLIGPAELLYMFYDCPELIHECMKTWFELADYIISKVQEQVTLDELYLAEDICYNHACLISEDMMKEFLLPYYQELIKNIKLRQVDKSRHLYLQIDTDGKAEVVIPIYQSIGMAVMNPFEVASGSDVVEIGKRFPDLVIAGGIDKRILATTTYEIDKMLDRIMPPMKQRGGYIPTCDHGVPEEVSFENYLHFRKRLLEYSK